MFTFEGSPPSEPVLLVFPKPGDTDALPGLEGRPLLPLLAGGGGMILRRVPDVRSKTAVEPSLFSTIRNMPLLRCCCCLGFVLAVVDVECVLDLGVSFKLVCFDVNKVGKAGQW